MHKESYIHRDITWEGQAISLSFCPHYTDGISHLEITTSDRSPLPITETGYKSHFFGQDDELSSIDQIEITLIGWLNKEAKSPNWKKTKGDYMQPSLF